MRTAVVWVTHISRISRAMRTGPVIAHNRGCATPILRLLAWLAVRRGTRLHLLLLDTPADLAMAGAARSAGGWCRRPPSGGISAGGGGFSAAYRKGNPAPALTAHVVTRAGADRLKEVRFDR